MRNELHHIQVTAAAAAASHEAASAAHKAASSTDLRLQVLCRMLSTVYGSRFSAREDQAAVQKLIAQELDVTEAELRETESDITMQTNVPSTLRVGAVYMHKGVLRVLAHTACLCQHMQMKFT
jgi:hypothetical protein